ncbi:TMEM256 [Cordylochernes scorpioides]|uniref:TMEM256 n=1 Tax=Cordylochernes scorpioides TaxID=51811 RepID=A0ABY6L072_9ARAC|nr:TMEM256 [Cordylochernes scorpioides]
MNKLSDYLLKFVGCTVLNHRPDVSDYHKQVFQTGNLYHFFHTLAILASPFARRPKLVAGWFFMGIVLFSGSCYTLAITGSSHAGLMAPYGGFCFLLGWLSLAF